MWSSWAHCTKRLASVIVRTGSSASSWIATKGAFYFAAAAVKRCFTVHHSSLSSICESVQGTESRHDSPESSVGAGKRSRNWFWVITHPKKPLKYVCTCCISSKIYLQTTCTLNFMCKWLDFVILLWVFWVSTWLKCSWPVEHMAWARCRPPPASWYPASSLFFPIHRGVDVWCPVIFRLEIKWKY